MSGSNIDEPTESEINRRTGGRTVRVVAAVHADCTTNNRCFFEVTRKRRKGCPSETQVKKGVRIVHGDKELLEKLGRNDLCSCHSGRLFQTLLS